MAGEAASLQNFLMSFGYTEDKASAKKALADQAVTEKKATAINAAEVAKRQKTEEKSGAKRSFIADNEAKRVRERNAVTFKDTSKHLEQLTGLVGGVAKAAGLVAGAFAGSATFGAIVNTANAFSRLSMEQQRTGASPKHIEALVYGLSQLGVSKDEARGSFDSFSQALKSSPGLKNMLAGKIDVSGDDAEIMARLGSYFSSMPRNVAMNRAGSMGIGSNLMLTLEKQAELQGKMQEYGGASMGLDADKAAADGRAFTQAYDRLATDLEGVQKRIEATFFKPMTQGMHDLSVWMEKNPDQVTAITAAFEVLAATSLLRVLPVLARISGVLNLMKAPVWLLRLLGLGSATAGGLAAGALLGSTEPLNAGEPTLGPDGNLHRSNGSTVSGPWDGKTRSQRRAEFGRDLGMEPNVPGPTGSDDPLKNYIAGHEGGGYDVVYGHNERGGPNAPPKPITQMTIGEVLAYQAEMKAKNGTVAWPVGRAQWVHQTLKGLTKGMDPNTKFSPELQERLFDRSISGRVGQGAEGFRSEWDSLKNRSDAEINAMIQAHRNYHPALHPVVAKAVATVKAMGESYTNPDGSSTSSNFDPKTGMVTAPGGSSPFGTLDKRAFSAPPLGTTGGNTSVGGDNHFTQNVTISGIQNPSEMAAALKAQANKGTGILRNMQGNSQ